MGGGVDAVRIATKVNGVEVRPKDFVLAPFARHLGGNHELLGLTREAELIADHRVLHILLGNG